MGKRLIHAVAGSGKTTTILDAIAEDQRSIILTYTTANLRSLETSLVEKYGCVPEHVTLQSYFSFLYTFCFRPFYSYTLRDNSFTWEIPGTFPTKDKLRHYVTTSRYLYGNRVAKFLIETNTTEKINYRLSRYYDHLFIDEVQDFAGNDFNLLLELLKAEIDILLVGDFYQHTFDTSRDGNIRSGLHKKGSSSYLDEFRNAGVEVDETSLNKTHRCSPTVCDFISETTGIPIESHRTDQTLVTIVEDLDTSYDDCERPKQRQTLLSKPLKI